jgi:hypothetical protein
MAVNEPICIFWDVYIALVYGVLYLCFVSYPIVFGELRGWSPGLVGLGYMGIGIGGCCTIVSEPLLRKMINAHKHDPETGKPYPEAMVSVIVIAAVLVPVGEMIFAWCVFSPYVCSRQFALSRSHHTSLLTYGLGHAHPTSTGSSPSSPASPSAPGTAASSSTHQTTLYTPTASTLPVPSLETPCCDQPWAALSPSPAPPCTLA